MRIMCEVCRARVTDSAEAVLASPMIATFRICLLSAISRARPRLIVSHPPVGTAAMRWQPNCISAPTAPPPLTLQITSLH